jgi:hypothetical protein
LIACELSLGLSELNFKWPLIDFRKEIALLHEVAFFKGDMHELSINPAADCDCIGCDGVTKSTQINRHVDLARRNGNNSRSAAGAASIASTSPATSGIISGACCGRVGRSQSRRAPQTIAAIAQSAEN